MFHEASLAPEWLRQELSDILLALQCPVSNSRHISFRNLLSFPWLSWNGSLVNWYLPFEPVKMSCHHHKVQGVAPPSSPWRNQAHESVGIALIQTQNLVVNPKIHSPKQWTTARQSPPRSSKATFWGYSRNGSAGDMSKDNKATGSSAYRLIVPDFVVDQGSDDGFCKFFRSLPVCPIFLISMHNQVNLFRSNPDLFGFLTARFTFFRHNVIPYDLTGVLYSSWRWRLNSCKAILQNPFGCQEIGESRETARIAVCERKTFFSDSEQSSCWGDDSMIPSVV